MAWKKHNESYKDGKPTPEYKAWQSMKSRCLAPGTRMYPRYGGRGITIYQPWINSFPLFLAHVGRKPGPKYSLGRIDNDGHYDPINVRWETTTEQIRNRVNTIPMEVLLEACYYLSLGIRCRDITSLTGIKSPTLSELRANTYLRS